jgi:hypothetical protein
LSQVDSATNDLPLLSDLSDLEGNKFEAKKDKKRSAIKQGKRKAGVADSDEEQAPLKAHHKVPRKGRK